VIQEQKERRRGLVRRAPAIVRRLLPHRLALAAAAVTVALAATLLAAFASFSATVSANAVRTSLAGNPGTTVSVTASVTSAAGATQAGGKLAAALRRALPGLPVTVWSAASSDYLDIPPGRGLPHAETQLSGGEQQRVAIARALANSPALLLADEPTGQLDSETAGQIMRLLRSIVHDEGITAIVATHDATLISLADRVLNLKDGLLESQ
jgi:ATPase subunit of ABC transporter with duplicated ATPase domains